MTWITTDNVSAEAWRHLLEYANHELAVEAIIKRHGNPNNKALQNYKKQARNCVPRFCKPRNILTQRRVHL